MTETIASEASAPLVAVAGESKRTLANRRNAQKSTGPKSARGKAASARKAVSHGLFCPELVLEDPAEREQFARFTDQLERRFAPADVLERLLLERFVNAAWRLRRAAGAEADVVAKLRWRDGTTLRLGHLLSFGDPCLDNLLRYEQGFERSMYRALSQLQRAQKLRKQGQRDEPGEELVPDEPGGAVGADEPVGDAEACAAPCKNEPNGSDGGNPASMEETTTCGDSVGSPMEPVGESEATDEATEATDQTDDHANDDDPTPDPTADPAPSGITHEIYRTLTASLDRAGLTGPPTRPKRRRYLSPFEHDLRHSHHLCDNAEANLRFIWVYEAQLDDPDEPEGAPSPSVSQELREGLNE